MFLLPKNEPFLLWVPLHRNGGPKRTNTLRHYVVLCAKKLAKVSK